MENNKTGMDEELRLAPEEAEGADANALKMNESETDPGADFTEHISEQIAKSRMLHQILEARGKDHSCVLV